MTAKKMASLFTGLLALWASTQTLSATPNDPIYVALPDLPQVNDEFILEIDQGDSLHQVNGVDTLTFTYTCDQVELDESSPFYLEIDNSWFCESGHFQYTLSLGQDLKTISLQIIRTNGITSGYGHVCTLRGGVIVKVDEDISRMGLPGDKDNGLPYPNPCQDHMTFPSHWLSTLSSIEVISSDGKKMPVYPVGNQIDLASLQQGYFILRFHFKEEDLFFKCLKI